MLPRMLSTGLLLCLSVPAIAGQTVRATLAWVDRIELSSPLSSQVARVAVTDGEQVAAGTLLIQLDQGALIAQRDAARAKVRETQLALAEAQRERDRQQELYDRTLLSEHEVNTAQIAYNRANSSHHTARADLALKQRRLEYSEIRAPYAARVIKVLVQDGQTVVNRCRPTPMIVLARAGKMQARALLEVSQLERLDIGDGVNVAVGATGYEGVVTSIGLEPVEEQPQLRYAVNVEFALPDGVLLRAGRRVQLDLP